ncbi:MAG: hypothetical protein IJA67_02920 [Oscillospiraceae bacterium]|nr:hypothetical protein [Oscillospiraceae bacterium]
MKKILFETIVANAKGLPACDFPNDEVLRALCLEMTPSQRMEFTSICLKKGVMEYNYGNIVTKHRGFVVVTR